MNAVFDALAGIGLLAASMCLYYFTLSEKALVRRRKRHVDPITDMVNWKRQRRREELRDWEDQFRAITFTPQPGIPGRHYVDLINTARHGKPHKCTCGTTLYGTSAIDAHRLQHSWEVRNLGRLPDDYVTLYRRNL